MILLLTWSWSWVWRRRWSWSKRKHIFNTKRQQTLYDLQYKALLVCWLSNESLNFSLSTLLYLSCWPGDPGIRGSGDPGIRGSGDPGHPSSKSTRASQIFIQFLSYTVRLRETAANLTRGGWGRGWQANLSSLRSSFSKISSEWIRLAEPIRLTQKNMHKLTFAFCPVPLMSNEMAPY